MDAVVGVEVRVRERLLECRRAFSAFLSLCRLPLVSCDALSLPSRVVFGCDALRLRLGAPAPFSWLHLPDLWLGALDLVVLGDAGFLCQSPIVFERPLGAAAEKNIVALEGAGHFCLEVE